MNELFRQGPLLVVDDGAVVSVRFGDAVRVDVKGDEVVFVDGAADHVVVSVVVRALIERAGGWFHAHAGLVGDGTLIVGESGAGKTTTTLALAAQAKLLTDDVVFVQRQGAALVARPMRRPLHVGEVTLRMFPALRARLVEGRSSADKSIIAVDDVAEDAIDVARLVFPVIADVATTTKVPLTPTEALPLLLRGSAMVAWPGLPRAQEHLDTLAALAGLPSCRLTLGRDAIDDPQVVRRVVDG